MRKVVLWLLRFTIVTAVIATVVAGPPILPAGAHPIGDAEPSNYRVQVLRIDPPVPGLEVRSVDAGTRLEVVHDTDRDVTVLGYEGEPYLRIGPAGASENVRSPATYINQDLDGGTPVPSHADPGAEPEWRQISSDPSAAWYEHRAHWMAPEPPRQLTIDDGQELVIFPEWQVDLLYGDQPVAVIGELRWVPAPNPLPWIGLALACLLAVLAFAATRPSPMLLAGMLWLLLLVDGVHAASAWMVSSAVLSSGVLTNVLLTAWWGVAALALWRLSRTRTTDHPAPGLVLLVLATGSLLFVHAGGLDALWNSQVLGVVPGWVSRWLIAVTLGLGDGLLLASLAGLWRIRGDDVAGEPEPREVPETEEGTASGEQASVAT